MCRVKCPKCGGTEFSIIEHDGTQENDLSYDSYKCKSCETKIWNNIWTGEWEMIE